MKKNVFIIACIVLVGMFAGQTLKAQSDSEEIDMYQAIFGMEKKAIVAEFLKLESTDVFWPIYDEYELSRKALGKDRIKVLEGYMVDYESLDDEKSDELIKSMIGLRKGTDKLLDTYYKKVKKVSGSKVAAEFFQIEAFFLTEIRASVLESIPYIGEFDE